MDFAKTNQSISKIAGLVFALGLNTFIVFNIAREVPLFSFFSLKAGWLLLGVFSGLIGVGFLSELLRIRSLASIDTSIPESLGGATRAAQLATVTWVSIKNLIAAGLFAGGAVFLNFYLVRSGDARFSPELKFFLVGTALAFLALPYFKNRFGVVDERSASQITPLASEPFWNGEFEILETAHGFRLKKPIAVLNPDPNHPYAQAFNIDFSEIQRFRVMRSLEESTLYFSRSIDGDVERLAISEMSKLKFTMNPKIRPSSYIEEGAGRSAGVWLSIEGPGLFYFLPVQSRFLGTALRIEELFRSYSKTG